MSHKDRFFDSYGKTHLTPRKGPVTRESLAVRAAAWRQLYSRFLPADRDARILDAGCGFGAVVWWLRTAGYQRAEGIDISAEQIQQAAELGIDGLVQADLEEFLQTHAATYDVILLRDVLEHFDKDAAVRVLDLIHGALKARGTLIVQAPNGESPFGGRIRYGDFTHETAFTSASISQLLRVTGFEGVGTYPVRPVVRGIKSALRFVAWRVIELIYQALLNVEVGPGRFVVTQNVLAVGHKGRV